MARVDISWLSCREKTYESYALQHSCRWQSQVSGGNMESIVIITFKGIGMLLAILGGLIIARYGFRLYRDGAGSGRDQAGFEVGPVKVKAQSVGSVVMATAFLWVWAGVVLSPNLERKGDEIRIYSIVTPAGDMKTQAVTAKIPVQSSALKNNPEELKKLLQKAVSNSRETKTGIFTELNGKPALIDASLIDVSKNPSGDYLLSTKIKSGIESATVVFEPKIGDAQIVFTPSSFKK